MDADPRDPTATTGVATTNPDHSPAMEVSTVHPLYLGRLAFDIANERMRVAEQDRLADLARHGADKQPAPPAGPLRRSLARLVASVSRGAGALALRLDRGVADRLQTHRSGTADA